jgi:hypothetical protein
LLDFVTVFIKPAGEGTSLGQRQRHYLRFDLFHAHGRQCAAWSVK